MSGTGTGMKTLKPGTGTGTSPGKGIKSHEIENLALLVYLFEVNGKNVITSMTWNDLEEPGTIWNFPESLKVAWNGYKEPRNGQSS